MEKHARSSLGVQRELRCTVATRNRQASCRHSWSSGVPFHNFVTRLECGSQISGANSETITGDAVDNAFHAANSLSAGVTLTQACKHERKRKALCAETGDQPTNQPWREICSRGLRMLSFWRRSVHSCRGRVGNLKRNRNCDCIVRRGNI